MSTTQPIATKTSHQALQPKRLVVLRQLFMILVFLASLVGPVSLPTPARAETCSTVALTASEDTYVSAANVTYNNGGSTEIHVDNTTGTARRGALLKWDLSSIPSNATVSSASLQLYVTDASGLTFNLYNMRRTWVEGTSTQAASSTSANWNTYNGVNTWGGAGITSTTTDRYNTNLWGAGTSTFSTTGSKTVALNTSGVAVVQGWIAGTTANYGLTMQNYVSATANAVFFTSSEGTTAANRPILNITYCIPQTITTTGTLNTFSAPAGIPSAAQTYTVAGSSLTENIAIAAPAGFELSTDNATYSSGLTLTQSGGAVPATTIYVRLNSATEGSYSGNITHTSAGAASVNVAASGRVGTFCDTASLEAAEDTYMSANDVTYNNGGNTEIHVDNTTGTARRGALLKWNLSSIPNTAAVSAASLQVYVNDASPLVFNLYNMRRTWVEGTSTQTGSSTSANWNTYDGANTWGTGGAANTGTDRYDTNLWGAGTSTFSTTGSKTVDLNADGVAVVQGWVAGTTPNYGLTMQNYTAATSNAVYFYSSENTTAANRPKLNVTYCVTYGPTITTSGTLNAFSTQPGVPSAAQTYTVSGLNLTENIAIAAPTGFELSTDGTTYSSGLTLAQSGGAVPATTVYVRLSSATEGSYSGNITHTSAGAAQKDLAASGTVAVPPTTVTFQFGVSGYTGTVDTFLRGSTEGTTNFGASTGLEWDENTGSTTDEIALLRFNNLFASQGGPIPDGATITSASLTYMTTDLNSGSTANGDPANVYESLVDWDGGAVTYNTFGGEAGVQADEYNPTLVASAVATALSTAYTIEVTASLQRWASGTANYGWVFLPTNQDGVTIYSSEFATLAYRPLLSVSYSGGTPIPTITTNGALTAFSAQPGVASAPQTYTVAGSNLAENIVITPPYGFEISTDGAGYVTTLSLEQSGGVVPTTTIYVRLEGDPGNYSGNIAHTSSGAAQVDVAVSGTVAPYYTLTVSASGGSVALNPPGGSYISGTVVTLTATPDSGYEFSGWSGALSGSANPTTLTMDGDKSVTANFVVSQCSTANLAATADTWIRESYPSNNYGGDVALSASPNSTYSQGHLYLWDVSAIPDDATVSSASLSFYVTEGSAYDFSLYNMRRAWVEGTNIDAAGSGASWTYYGAGTGSWGTAGAASTTTDRYNTDLWNATATTFGSTGNVTIPLNSSGVAVVQDWIDGGLVNYGLTLQNYSGSDSDYWKVASTENTSGYAVPTLNVTYCVAGTNPTVLVASSLSAFTTTPGVPSAEQSYTVSGMNLTENIVITAPADFQISTTSGSGYVSTLSLPQSGGSVAGTLIYVRFLRATAGSSSGEITHTSLGAASKNVAVSGSATNQAPVAPVLVQPADAATGVSTAPALQVTVSDSDADALNVSFYGRPADGNSGEDFMIVLIPDPQNESQSAPAMFTAQTNWIKDNKTANNIAFVTTLGDMVNTSSSTAQYDNADAAIDILDAGGVWYTVAPGNHDTEYGTTYYPNYFGLSRYADYEVADGYWFGGGYDDYNTYSLFSAGGMDFILINLKYSPSTAVLNWADALLKTHSDRRAIVEQHNILNVDNSWNSQTSFNALKDNPNLFLMVCGHMHTGSDGAAYRAELGDDGHTIHIVQADYQDMNNGNGYLRLLRFSPADDTIYMTTYSPYTGGSLTSTSNYDQANLAYDMAAYEPYTLIGTASGVASGSTASVTWSGLSADNEYEWYAVVSDGASSTTGSTWSFTTGSTANQPPVITESDPQAVTMSEDGTPTAFNLTLNATDADAGDTLTWSIPTNGSHGAAAASGTGASKSIAYAPAANYNGSDSFVVQVSDGTASDTLIVNVTVTGVNDAPVISGGAALSTPEDVALAIALADLTVADVDNSYPTGFTLTVLPGANYTLAGNTLTPAANFNGALTVPVKVNDGAADSNTYNLSITVTPVNDLPVADPQSVTTTEDAPKAIMLTGSDVETGALSFAVVTNPDHGVLSGTPPALTYTPAANYHGSDSFTFKANDGTVDSSPATVSITVTPVNDAPVLTGIGDRSVAELVLLSFTAAATDADGDDLTFALTGAPAGAAIDPAGGAFTWTPAELQGPGSYPITVKVCDDQDPALCDSELITVTVGEANTAPVLAAIPDQNAAEGALLTFTASAGDTDWPANPLTFSLDGAPAGAAIGAGSGVFTWTPTEAQGPGAYTFDVCVSDGVLSDCETLTVTVSEDNTAPVITESDPQAVTMSEDGAPTAFSLTLHAGDADGDTLTWSIAAQATSGTASASGSGSSKAIAYTPNPNYHGSDSFTVQVSDGVASDSLTVNVTIAAVNDAPVLNAIGNKAVAELSSLSFNASAANVDGDSLTFSLAGAPAGASITPSGAFAWTPAEAQGPGSYPLTVSVCDDGDPALCDEEAITITVSEVNAAPVLGAIGDKSIDELSLLSFTASATDTDLPANTLTFSLAGAPSGASITPAGDFSWTPTEAQGPGSYPFDVCVSDGALNDCETITITVSEANTAPVAQDQPVTTAEDTAKPITLGGSDADGDALTFAVVTGPAHGALSGTAPALTYTPAANYNGPDSFTFKANDGTVDSNTATVSITVTPVNDAPVANPQSVTVTKDTAKPVTLSGSDVDSNPLTFTVVTPPAHGALTGTAPNLTYTPATGYSGSDSFTFKVNDGTVDSSPAAVSLTVSGGTVPPLPSSFYGEIHIYDNPPVAGNLVEAYKPGDTGAVATAVIQLYAGDLVYAINVPGASKGAASEGDPVTFKIDGRVVAVGTWHSGTNIELNIHPPQALPGGPYSGFEGSAISFSGSANDWGSDALTYQWDWENDGTYDTTGAAPSHTWPAAGVYTVALKVTDAQGGEGTATATVTVSNAAPVLAPIGDKAVAELATLSFTAGATDSDPLVFSLVGAPAGASITPAGAFTWTPTEAQGPGSYPLTVKVCDNRTPAACDEEPITVTVSEVNVAPVLTAIGDQSIAELAALSFTTTATDGDLPANSLTYSLTGAPGGAAITAGGAFTWTPTEAQGPGAYTFDVCVSDGALSDCETITVTVSEVNSAPLLAAIGDKSVAELASLSFNASASDGDVPANSLSFSLAAGAPTGAAITPSGAFAWTPSEAQGPGTYPVSVKVCDNAAAPLCDEETITITVSEVNLAPLAAGQSRTTAEDSALNGQLVATDGDLPANSLTYAQVSGPAHGALTVNGDGSFIYTPALNYHGPDSFTFKANDGTADSNTATVTITVTPVNDAPACTVPGLDTAEDAPAQAPLPCSDPDGDPLTLVIVVAPGHGTLALVAGNLVYTPDPDYNGTDSFSFAVSDGTLQSSPIPVTVTVAAVNDAPVAADQAVATDEDIAKGITLAATDVDGNPLTFTVVTPPAHGALSGTAPALTYTPAPGYSGPDSFTFKANDGTIDSNLATVSITVATVNDPPTADPQALTTPEDTALAIALSGSDPENSALSFTVVAQPIHGALSGTAPNLTYIPAANYHGPDSFTFTASDGELTSPPATIAITVTPVNDAPVLTAIGNKSTPELALLSFTAGASDVDGDALTFSLLGAPAGASITAGGAFTWTPSEAQGPGTYPLTVKVCDDEDPALCDEEALTITVSEVNLAPVLGAIGDKTVAELSLLSFTAGASDADLPANSLSFSLTGAPAGAAITPAGAFTWTPTEAQGPQAYTFDVCVSDGAASDCETITVTVSEVNLAPVLGAIGDKSVAELSLLGFTASAADADLPLQTLTFALTGAPAGAAITSAGAFTWTPTEAQGPGSYPVTVRVCDNAAAPLCDEETLTVTVSEVNLAPVLGAVGNKSTPELSLLSFTAGATDGDLPANTLTFSLANGAGGSVPAGAAITTGGAFTWTPAEAQGPGAYTFDVCVSDGALSDCETITVSVSEVNVAPVLGAVGDKATPELALLSFTAGATDADLPADTLTYSLAGAPAGAAINPASGAFAWTPAEAQGPNAYTFDVCVSDGDAGDCETITVTVSEVNLAPLAQAQSRSTAEDSALNGQLVATDGDLPANPLTYAKVGDPAHGTVMVNGDGSFTYTPALNYHGPDSFTFKANDGTADSNTATVSITVTPVNDAPVAAGQAVTTDEDAAKAITLSATDADGDALTYSVVTAPAHGALSGAAPNVTYTPAANYHGPDSFTFKANDGTVDSNVATVTITVTPVNDAPVAAGQAVTTDEDAAKAITLAATDVDGDALTYTVVTPPAHGALSGAAPALTYTPALDYHGPDSFTFKANDGTVDSNVATVTITVTPVNDAPVCTPAGLNAVEDAPGQAPLPCSDVDGDPLSLVVIVAPQHGTLALVAGNLVYTPDPDYNGADVFSLAASDGTAQSNTVAVTVTVAAVNDAPVLNPIGAKEVTELNTLSFNASAVNVDGDSLTFSLVSAPAGAAITPSGAFTWTPDATQGPDTYTFDVCVSDGTLNDCETITVTVKDSIITHSIALVAGWNLVSFNVHPTDTAIAAVLASIAGEYDLVYAWDATGAHAGDGNWLKYAPSAPPYQNSLTSLTELQGFWIHMLVADTLEVSGLAPVTTSIPLSTAAGGWNLVGYPAAADGALPAALRDHGVGTDFTLVFAYHPDDAADPWKLFDRTGAPYANDLTALSPGWGYWVYVTAAHTWTVSYAAP